MKYIIQYTGEFEVDAEDAEKAKESAKLKFEELEKIGVKTSNAKVADKATGYFI